MKRSTYRRYRHIIAEKCWQEKDITAFRSMLRKCFAFNATKSTQVKSPETGLPLTHLEVGQQLLALFRGSAPYSITPEQTQKGLDWLRKTCFTSKGEFRQAKSVPFDYHELVQIKHILNNFSHWTFDGITDMGDMRSVFVPIYTLHATDGKEFTYAPGPQGQVYYAA